MTELNFLIKLLLDSNLDTDTKKLVADRIREVESMLTQPIGYQVASNITRQSGVTNIQAPSMQRILEQNPDLAPVAMPVNTKIIPPKEQEIVMPNGSSIKGPRKW